MEPIHQQRNYGVGTGVTCLISSVQEIYTQQLHQIILLDMMQAHHMDLIIINRVSYSTNLNIMGTSATTSQVDEDNILVSSL